MNEQVVHSIAQLNGIAMDYIAFRHAVSLLHDLHVCWDTRALPDRDSGWTIFATSKEQPPKPRTMNLSANLSELETSPARDALDSPVWIQRRVPNDSDVASEIVQTIETDQCKKGSDSL